MARIEFNPFLSLTEFTWFRLWSILLETVYTKIIVQDNKLNMFIIILHKEKACGNEMRVLPLRQGVKEIMDLP